jgi:homoserine acetyltransferase
VRLHMMMAKQGIGATKVASVVGGSMGKSACTACHTVCFLLSTFSKSVDKTIIVSCLCSFSLRNYAVTFFYLLQGHLLLSNICNAVPFQYTMNLILPR